MEKKKEAKKAVRQQCNHCAAYFNPNTIKGAVHLASCRIYNGWPNYETWLVSLWIDNEQGSHEYWHEAAREAISDAKAGKGNEFAETLEQKAYLLLADRMKSEFDDARDDQNLNGMWSDMLKGAFEEVNWNRIAEHHVDAVKEAVDEDAS